MITRELQSSCIEFSKQYPVLTITGPRQSGKTTLARMSFPDKPYINLEEPDKRRVAIDDPRGFLEEIPEGAVLDEIQRAPELPSYIQAVVDKSGRKGMFVLTGSQQFEVSQTINQSLAGRTAMIKLLPLSMKELSSWRESPVLDDLLIQGFYPRVQVENLQPYHFYMNYFETYVQRDLRQISQIDNLQTFEKFLRLIAGRTGQLLNYNSLANDIGVSQPTIRKWTNILQASYLIFLLPPYYRNIGKRLIKTPKVYFCDVGMLCYLLEIESVAQLRNHPLRGNIFENFVIIEFLKKRFNKAKDSNLFFFRDRTGHEVDLVIREATALMPIEIKSSKTWSEDFSGGIQFLKKLFPSEVKDPRVIYTGADKLTHQEITCLPWRNLFSE